MPATFSCEFSAGREDYKACSYHSICMYHIQSGVRKTDSCLQYCEFSARKAKNVPVYPGNMYYLQQTDYVTVLETRYYTTCCDTKCYNSQE